MSNIKVTGVYDGAEDSESFADHLILSNDLKDILDIQNNDNIESTDINEMSLMVTAEGSLSAGQVHGSLVSISFGEYLKLKFNAKSSCRDILESLKQPVISKIENIVIDVSGKYGFRLEGKDVKSWEIKILEDKSALLTIETEVQDVTFR